MVTRVNVTYRGLEIDEDLDEKILQFFNTLDFVCIDRIYDSIVLLRHLTFEKHSKEIEDGSKRNKEAQLTA